MILSGEILKKSSNGDFFNFKNQKWYIFEIEKIAKNRHSKFFSKFHRLVSQNIGVYQCVKNLKKYSEKNRFEIFLGRVNTGASLPGES